jgi:two-component system chemotaxis response regulator CheB
MFIGHSESIVGIDLPLKQVANTVFQKLGKTAIWARKIRVLIIDDSASVRQTLTAVLEEDPDIEVMGVASDPFMAARKRSRRNPRRHHARCRDAAHGRHHLPAQADGAASDPGGDVLVADRGRVGDPDAGAGGRGGRYHPEAEDRRGRHLAECRCASRRGEERRRQALGFRQYPPPAARCIDAEAPEKKLTADAMLPPPTGRAMAKTTEMVVCVGASTGGTEALRELLEALPANRRASSSSSICRRNSPRPSPSG